jgi:hypothetical protein
MKVRVGDKRYPFDGLKVSEARLIKSTCGMTVKGWQDALNEGDADAMAALVWVLRRRDGETGLAFLDVDFDLTDVEVESDEPVRPTGADEAPTGS